MSASLITENFLLQTATAVRLYHEYARDLPIIDYHCHLVPAQVADDYRFRNLADIWLAGDHYKWRAMRSAGVPERFCTGDASDWEKFEKWAETVPQTLRNPLYHWTHLELNRPFGINDRLLGPATARSIWDECNEKLALPEFSARGIMRQMNVVLSCTTDDPTDSLEPHRRVAEDKCFPVRLLPAFRPDKALAIESPEAFNAWVDRLAAAADIHIVSFADFIEALDLRHRFFHSMGCRLADHGLDRPYGDDFTDAQCQAIFAKLRSGKQATADEVPIFKSAMLYHFGLMHHKRGWTQQFHIGALRNNNSRLFASLGPDTGFDSIDDQPIARPLARMLDRLDREEKLTRTILFNLNPRDNALMTSMLGNFQDGSTPGKMQYGPAWWFLDQMDGMERQIEDLSNMGLLARFVGMETDSRSFLSYTRHEYFRRILCNMLGTEMERGILPGDVELVGAMVRDICYFNAKNYFGFDLPETSVS